MDPSAVAATMNAGGAAAQDSSEQLASRQQLSLPCLTHNVRIVENVRGLMSIVAGTAAGIWGATGMEQVSDELSGGGVEWRAMGRKER